MREARRRRAFVPITIRDDLAWEEVSRIACMRRSCRASALDSGLLRDYPMGEVTAHVLGYVGPRRGGRADRRPAARAARVPHRQERHREDLRPRPARPRRAQPLEVNALGREISELDRQRRRARAATCASPSTSSCSAMSTTASPARRAPAPWCSTCTAARCWRWPRCRLRPNAFGNGLQPRRLARRSTDDPRAPLINKAIAGSIRPARPSR